MTSYNPVAAIVGMGPGLSAAIAERFASGGYAIAGFARNPSKSEDLAKRLSERGPTCKLFAVDASDFEALQKSINTAEAELGSVDILVYNAYRATMVPPSSLSPEALIADLRVNVGGALAAVQAVLPGMRARKRGTVLLTGGALALDPTGWLPAASLAVGKAGIRNLAQSLNADLADAGIRVATVTIAGPIEAGTAFAPEAIAERYWRLHASEGSIGAEYVFDGDG